MQQIMLLMKYSLDLSNPWIPQYYQGYTSDASKQTIEAKRALYKVWLAEEDDELLKMLSTSGDPNLLRRFG